MAGRRLVSRGGALRLHARQEVSGARGVLRQRCPKPVSPGGFSPRLRADHFGDGGASEHHGGRPGAIERGDRALRLRPRQRHGVEVGGGAGSGRAGRRVRVQECAGGAPVARRARRARQRSGPFSVFALAGRPANGRGAAAGLDRNAPSRSGGLGGVGRGCWLLGARFWRTHRKRLKGLPAPSTWNPSPVSPLCYTSSPTDRINSNALLFSTTPS